LTLLITSTVLYAGDMPHWPLRLFGFGLLCFTIAGAGLLQEYLHSQSQPATLSLENLAASSTIAAHPLGVVTKTSPCTLRGSLPDTSCSPGAIFTDATAQLVCTPGYAKEVRSVSVSLKKRVYAAYNIPYPQPTGSYELDHVVPLAIGGNNDAANLFPQAAKPRPGFKEKDVVEMYLRQQVCSGTLPLETAQKLIAHNWVQVYHMISPQEETSLKAQFRNWAN